MQLIGRFPDAYNAQTQVLWNNLSVVQLTNVFCWLIDVRAIPMDAPPDSVVFPVAVPDDVLNATTVL